MAFVAAQAQLLLAVVGHNYPATNPAVAAGGFMFSGFHRRGLKRFDRIARFDNAFRMRNKYPSLDWLSVALACGYYDHQHFAKDCKELTHLTPTSYFEQESKSPERLFGLHED
ncbi:MAG: helix-turn-helix domain-containing protein [Cytophagaceae bacterium]|nr:helix-turn-helix domain-containing protein [Cytophagaceae bacterium]